MSAGCQIMNDLVLIFFENSLRLSSGVRTPRREAEILERGEEVEEAHIAAGRCQLRGAAVEERRAELAERLVDALAGVDREDVQGAVGGRRVGVERREPRLGVGEAVFLEGAQRVVVDEVRENSLVRNNVVCGGSIS